MSHFMGHHRGELGAVVGESEQSPGYVKLPIREREGIDGVRIENGDLVGEVRFIGGCNQAVHDAGELGMEPGVLVSAAVSRKYALMLANARRIRLGVPGQVG